MLSWKAHYLNKYPGGSVESSENSFRVYDAAGKLRVSMEKSSSGMECTSEKNGLEDAHDLAPIPKDSRIHKIVGNKIVRDDKADEREELKNKFLSEDGLKILSCEDLKAHGFEFDKDQQMKVEGKVGEAEASDADEEVAEKKPAKKAKKK